MHERQQIERQQEKPFRTEMGDWVYITFSRLENILAKMDTKSFASLTGELYKRKIFMFSKNERLRLLAAKSFFEDSESFIRSCWRRASRYSNPRHVFEDSEPRYHLHHDCKLLHADYTNIEVPAQIEEKGPDAVRQFKQWANNNRAVFDEHPERFKLMVCTEFDIPVSELHLVRLDNTGVVGVVNENLNAVSLQIDRILDESGKFYYASPKNRAILSQYQKYSYLGCIDDALSSNRTGYSESEVKALLKYYHEHFKAPLKTLLSSYFRVKYNPELKFSGCLMNELGLTCCQGCLKKLREQARQSGNEKLERRWQVERQRHIDVSYKKLERSVFLPSTAVADRLAVSSVSKPDPPSAEAESAPIHNNDIFYM